MKLTPLFYFILIIFMSSGCKKDEPQITNPDITTSNSAFLPFTVGNYWYYDLYKVIDSTGMEESLNYADTAKVIAEEMINGNTYFVIEQDSWLSQDNRKDTLYYRDSSGYIVNVDGDILFSSVDFNNILHTIDYDPTPWVVEYSVSDAFENHSVPSGDFDCLNFKGRFFSTDPNDNRPDRFIDNCYSENVGIVLQSIFYASQFDVRYERRLSDFHLE